MDQPDLNDALRAASPAVREESTPVQHRWPLSPIRQPVRWYPTPQRLINRLRDQQESFILPPAMTRKPPWRE